nr:NADH dehydrogenase subunit 1 [Chroothece mobilis]
MLLSSLAASLSSLLASLLAIAFSTLLERKLMAAVQLRLGPNVLGLAGLLQPIADGLKLLAKEFIIPASSYSSFFLAAPIMLLALSLSLWALLPFGFGLVLADYNYSLLLLLAISSLNVLSIALAGWSSQSSYALLGALRSAAQLVSYELVFAALFLAIIASSSSISLTYIAWSQVRLWLAAPLLPLTLVFMIALLAETNRAPFDLPEAEAELVAGYNVEYSSGAFAMLFLAEYSNILLLSSLAAITLLGASPASSVLLAPLLLALKASSLTVLTVLVRAAYPRYRYDQLMALGWKALLPLVFAFLGAIIFMMLLASLSFLQRKASRLYNSFLKMSLL